MQAWFDINITEYICVAVVQNPGKYLCHGCAARQSSPLRRKFSECSIIRLALSFLMKHLVIGQREIAPNFSAFHWSPRESGFH